MQKITTYKALYNFTRELKEKDRRANLPDDSLDRLPIFKAKAESGKSFNHLRSHSCPFIEPKNDSGQSLLEMLQKTKPK